MTSKNSIMGGKIIRISASIGVKLFLYDSQGVGIGKPTRPSGAERKVLKCANVRGMKTRHIPSIGLDSIKFSVIAKLMR